MCSGIQCAGLQAQRRWRRSIVTHHLHESNQLQSITCSFRPGSSKHARGHSYCVHKPLVAYRVNFACLIRYSFLSRFVTKKGHCNVRQDIKDRLKYFADLFTTIVDLKWSYHVVIFVVTYISTWMGFGFCWWIIAFFRLVRDEYCLGSPGCFTV